MALAVVGMSGALVLAPRPGHAQSPADSARNEVWVSEMIAQLKLTPPQQQALNAFITTSAKLGKLPEISEAQFREMSLRQRLDYWSEHFALVLANAKEDAAAMHQFYGLLSPQQKAAFDEATKAKTYHPSVAADVVESAETPEKPNYRSPAHTDPDWLIKPTAENISRVYPSTATRDHLSGHVTLHCDVDTDGYLTDCVVGEETPKDRGFGNAALEVTAYMRMTPAKNYGVPTRGKVSVPITFTPDTD